MAAATICITDLDESGQINVEIDFGDDGVQDGSTAQYMAVKFMQWLDEQENALQTHDPDC